MRVSKIAFVQAPINRDELDILIEEIRLGGQDTQQVEVKEAAGGLPKSILETLSAFSNGAGGIIILGLQEQNNFAYSPQFKAKAIYDALAGALQRKTNSPSESGNKLTTLFR